MQLPALWRSFLVGRLLKSSQAQPLHTVLRNLDFEALCQSEKEIILVVSCLHVFPGVGAPNQWQSEIYFVFCHKRITDQRLLNSNYNAGIIFLRSLPAPSSYMLSLASIICLIRCELKVYVNLAHSTFLFQPRVERKRFQLVSNDFKWYLRLLWSNPWRKKDGDAS